MQKRIRWAISVFTAGLLLTGTAAVASHNAGPAPGRATTAAHKVDGTAAQQAVIYFQHKNGIIPASGIVGSQTNRAVGNAKSSVIRLVAYNQGSNFGKVYIRTCGIVTCSTYYSHQATVQLAAQLDGQGSVTDVTTGAGLACSGWAAITGAVPVAAGCLALAAAAFVYHRYLETIHHAADTAGCVRFRSLSGINGIAAVYADHSAICHSMDP